MQDLIQTGIRVSVDLGTSIGNAQNFAKVVSQVGSSATKASAEFKKSAQEISTNARSIGAAMGMTKASDLAKSALEATKSLGMLGASARNTKVQIQELTYATEKYVSVSSKLGMQTKTVIDHVAAWNKLSEVGMKRFAGSEWAAKLSAAVPKIQDLPLVPKAEGENQVALLDRLKSGWMRLTAVFLTAKAAISSIGAYTKLADEYSGLVARTKLVSGTQKELTTALNGTYQIALNTRSPLKEVTQLYYRMSVAMAGAGKSQQDALNMTDLVSKSLKISGASTTETTAALQQFSQAMQAGVLNGDEFRSVMENMPRLVTALTTALGVDIATLREWSSQGKLTFDVITNALESQKEKIDEDFKKIPITVGGALTNLQTAATKWLGDADQSSQGTKKLADAINYLATNFNTIIQPLEVFGSKLLEVSEIGMRFGKDVSPIIVKGLENIVATAKSVKTEMDAIDFAFSQKVNGDLEKYKSMAQGKFPLPEPTPEMAFVGPQLPQGREEYFSGRAKAAAKAAEDEKAIAKAQEQAQKVLEATIKQRMETERQAADLFKAQAETRLRALEAERDQMEFNFRLQIESATSAQQKEGVIGSLAKAREESLRKEFGIKQDMIAVEGEVLKAAYAGYAEELNRASELGLKEQEIIELKTRKLDVENQVKILNETAAQQQIDLNAQILNASNEAIKNKESEKKAMADLTNEFVKQSAILDKLQKAKAAGATPEQLKNLNETLQSMPTVEIFSDDQISKAIELHDQTARVKEGIDKLTDSQKAVREEALRTMAVVNSNLENTKELAKGLTEAFDSVGGAIGGMAVAMAEYGKQQATIAIQKQEEITKAAGDPEKVAKAETDASEKSARAQIKSYGDITKAAQGFFKKGTVGYQALGTAVKVFRAFEMAQTVMSTVKQIDQMGGVFSAFTDSLSKMSVLSDANTAKEIANAQKGAVAKGTEGAANQGSSGDPYSAFARVAAWVALMAGLGVVIGGGASAVPTMTGKDYAKQQEEAFASTLGSTVLGGAEASNSIQNSLDIIAANSTADLDYSQGLLKAFEELSAAMTGLASAVASSFKVNTGGLNLGKSTKYNFEDPGFGMLDNFLTKAIFGSTKVTRELAGQGIELLGQNLGKIIEKGIIKGTQYADVLVTTKKSAFFGLISSTKQTIETVTSQLPKPINDAVVNVFTKLRDTFVKSADLVGLGGAKFMESLGKITVNLGRIPFSENAKKNGELLNAAINRQADLMAKKLVPAYRESQIVGEGYFETFNRVANALTNGRAKLAQFNINAISYAQIMNKKGDIEKQVVVQSILASNATSDLKDVMAGLPGTADDAIEAFGNLVQIKDLFISTGQASVNLSNGLLVASGGIDKLKSNLETYFDLFFTDSEKLAATTVSLSSKFANFGLTMPALGETFDTATGKVVSARDGWRNFVDALSKDTSEAGVKLYAFALGMSGAFSEAIDLSMAVLQQSIDDQIAIYKVLGDTEKAISLERAKAVSAMSQSERDLANSMYALEDAVANVKKATDNQIAVYKLLGDTEKVTSLERTKALSAMTTADRATTLSLYALEDALNTAKKATDNQIAVYKLLGDTEKVTSLERAKALSAMSEADKAMALSLYALEDAVQAVSKSVDNQITIYKLLGEQDPAQKEKALALEREKAMAGMDASTRQFTLVVNSLTDANTALGESSTALQTAYDNLRNMRDTFVDLGQGLRDYYNELTGAQSPNMTPEARYTAAKTAFTEVSALAAQGIQSALGDLPSVAKEFLTVSREFNASGPAFQQDFASVLTALQSGMSAADRQIEIMNKQLAEAEKSNANLLKVDASTLSVNSSIANLQTALANFNSSLVGYNIATQAAVTEAIRQATAGNAASGVVAGAGAAADTAKAAADAAAAAEASKAKAEADAAVARAQEDAKAKADAAAAAAAAAAAERQRQAAAAAAAAAEAERQRQAAAAQAAAAAAAKIRADDAETQETTINSMYADLAKTMTDKARAEKKKAINDFWADMRATHPWIQWSITQGALTDEWSDNRYNLTASYAKGGYATPGMALVGERGPELINFAQPGQVYTAGQTQNILSANGDNQKKQTEAAEQQVIELKALVKIQQVASIEMIRELKALKAEMATLSKKAKLEAAS